MFYSCIPCPIDASKNHLEILQRGSLAFPISCYEEELSQEPVAWHWHDEWEFIFVLSGETFITVDTEKVPLHAGEGLFINSGKLHATPSDQLTSCIIHSFVFHPRIIGGSMDSIYWQTLVQPILQDDSLRFVRLSPDVAWQADALRSAQIAWDAIAYEHDEFENLSRFHLSHLFYLMLRNRPTVRYTVTSSEQVTSQRMKLLLQYIDEHYTEEITVQQLASCISVSESVCLRCFHRVIGMPPIQYLKQYRLEKAAGLLLTTSKKANEIGAECGFLDASYFTKSFRQWKGCTPLQFRQRSKNSTQNPLYSPNINS